MRNCDLNESGFLIVLTILLILTVSLAAFGFFYFSDFLIKSRAGDLVQWCRKWESAELNYYFRLDRLAGDANGNGIIADENEPVSPIKDLIRSEVIAESQKKIDIGDSVFNIKIGHDTVKGKDRNVFIICPSSECEKPLTNEEALIMQTADKLVDGSADALAGNFNGVAGVTLKCDGEAVLDVREGDNSADWNNSIYVGAAYYFDDYRQ
ncbi:MAG: hypothetical protein HY809_05685 [Nitrospirae bacterium]|nr:hypothetical protein [Nitrospirota bacterium]